MHGCYCVTQIGTITAACIRTLVAHYHACCILAWEVNYYKVCHKYLIVTVIANIYTLYSSEMY